MVKGINKEKITPPRIMIIGDVMVDAYIKGNVNRISPEAPIAILDAKKTYYSLGGAANVAKNIISLGATAYLVGYIGNDNYGNIFRRLTKKDKIKHKLFNTSITTSKSRYGYPQMLRVDSEEKAYPKETEIKQIAQYIKTISPTCVIISDYAKGCITQSLLNRVVRLSKSLKFKVFVDPKPKSNVEYKDCFLVKPNLREALELSDEIGIKDIGEDLRKRYNSNILITKGGEGMDLFHEGRHIYIPSVDREIYNVSGAGDAVIATIAYLSSLGWTVEGSVKFANKIAGDVVSSKNTSIQKIYNIKDKRWKK